MEIIATLIIAFAVIGLVSNFAFIFFMPANDRLNEEYLEAEKAKVVKYGP